MNNTANTPATTGEPTTNNKGTTMVYAKSDRGPSNFVDYWGYKTVADWRNSKSCAHWEAPKSNSISTRATLVGSHSDLMLNEAPTVGQLNDMVSMYGAVGASFEAAEAAS